jgi:hypothetical protein
MLKAADNASVFLWFSHRGGDVSGKVAILALVWSKSFNQNY